MCILKTGLAQVSPLFRLPVFAEQRTVPIKVASKVAIKIP
jgi:hypothetical protein